MMKVSRLRSSRFVRRASCNDSKRCSWIFPRQDGLGLIVDPVGLGDCQLFELFSLYYHDDRDPAGKSGVSEFDPDQF